MKAGVRALGIAESFRGDESTLAGAVVRASRVTDGFVAGIAPAWFNLLDLPAIRESADRPVLSVTFEESPGLEGALREAFEGDALDERLAVYRRQPERRRLTVNDERVFVRAVGCEEDEAADVVRAFTPEGGRPEPLRVARLAARAADDAFVAEG
ncbi:DUF99 domain-containing protein [Halobacteriales archaeon QH_1_68_42]|nr:MAG: DUF99 domain-containing protein [Halobacteriales archaeon QH_1_68_42]